MSDGIKLLGRRTREVARNMLRPALRSILGHFTWANVPLIQVEGLKDDIHLQVEHFQNFGFSSRPHTGAEIIIVPLGGSHAHAVVVASADRNNPCPVELEPGEAAVYNSNGDYVHLRADGTTYIKTSTKTVVDSPEVHLAGEGGAKVARIGDLVKVESGSSAGEWPIISGSDKVRAN